MCRAARSEERGAGTPTTRSSALWASCGGQQPLSSNYSRVHNANGPCLAHAKRPYGTKETFPPSQITKPN